MKTDRERLIEALDRLRPVLIRHLETLKATPPAEVRVSKWLARGHHIDVPEISPFSPVVKIDPDTGKLERQYRIIRYISAEDAAELPAG